MEIDGFGSLVHPDEHDWIETPGGDAVKVERVSEGTGSWTALLRAAKGTTSASVGDAPSSGASRPISGLSDWRSMRALQARHRR